MKLLVTDTALEVIALLRPLMPRLKREDKSLHQQLQRAAGSMVLNITEAEYSDPGNRKARFHSAAGSANETRGALLLAQAWGYLGAAQVGPALKRIDRVVAVLWRLTH